MSNIRVDGASTVPIDSLIAHPRNARIGKVDLIAESLAAHGQYRPIVAQTSTRYILAGNHTWKAAKSLGWTTIAVTWLDVDDAEADAVLIADNRVSDLAAYDDSALPCSARCPPSTPRGLTATTSTNWTASSPTTRHLLIAPPKPNPTSPSATTPCGSTAPTSTAGWPPTSRNPRPPQPAISKPCSPYPPSQKQAPEAV